MGKIAVAAIVSLLVIPISILVNHFVPDPYMDEIFHVPQAQRYCKGNFRSWNPMITTPPALYFLSLAHVASLFPGMLYMKWASSFSDVCSIVILWSINGILAVVCSVLVYEIITQLRPALDDRKATFYTVVLAMYPLHWFFTFLYYTDIASLTTVLAMYLACLRKKYWFSGLLGALAVSIRQTNIIWMLLVASSGIINITLDRQRNKVETDDSGASIRKNGQLAPENRVVSCSNVRKRKIGGTGYATVHLTPAGCASSKSCMPAHPYLFADNRHYPFYLWHKVIKAHRSIKYLLVLLYVYSWLSICTGLGKFKRKIWVLGYFLATAAVLVPAPLIEFRYYTMPFFFLILHSFDDDLLSWLLMGSLYLALDVFTMIMFLYRPFHWYHEPGTQRFIW